MESSESLWASKRSLVGHENGEPSDESEDIVVIKIDGMKKVNQPKETDKSQGHEARSESKQ
jgi:hypothetical protein